MARNIFSLDDLCRSVAPVFESLGLAAPTAMDVLDHVARQEEAMVHRTNRLLDQTSTMRPKERLPLRDQDGYDYGRVTDEIPEDIYFNLRRRYGADLMSSPEGRKDVLHDFPQFAVKTVSGKTTVGWRRTLERRARARQINFRGANFNGLAPA